MYVNFLLISNKFCDLSLLHWPLHAAWVLATIPLYNPLKSPVGAHVNKTTYNPLETWTFLGPKWHSHDGSMQFHRAQKSLDFQWPTPSHLPM
jgi:hypothetical protein